MTPRICIDGLNLSLAQGSGIATYGRNLLRALDNLGFESQVLYGPESVVRGDPILNEISLVDGRRAGSPLTGRQRYLLSLRSRWGLEAAAVKRSSRIIWPEDGAAPVKASGYWTSRDIYRTAHRAFHRFGTMTPLQFKNNSETKPPNAVHWTSTVPIFARKTVNIHTIHDIIPARLPFSTTENKSDYVSLIRGLYDRTDHIVTVSETTTRDLIETFGFSESKITTTYQSVSLGESGLSDEDVSAFLEDAFKLDWKGYFLHYGAVEPKKNLGRVVESYLRSKSRTPLILVGSAGWLNKPETGLLDGLAPDSDAASRIRQYDYLPSAVLANLVRGAKATVFPSLYEGFGLPVLESMLAGTAVLTSRSGSLPEIAGDAALFVDAHDVDSIAAGFRTLDADEELVNALALAGRTRAKFFSPENHEKRLGALYNKLGLGPRAQP